MYPAVLKIISYNTTEHDFAKVIAEDVFHVNDLTRLHETVLHAKQSRGREASITNTDSKAERARLQALKDDSRFYQVYHRFIQNVIGPIFNEKMSYSAHPRFRVQLSGSESISDWHRDTEVTGRHDQITVWLPCVDTFDQNTIWVETEYGKQDYKPIAVKYGEALLFDSSYLWHGSVTNTTPVTRVSFDFRLAPLKADTPAADLGILSARPPGYRVELGERDIQMIKD